MILDKLKAINLGDLSSAKHLQLLNSIDKLRSQGIDHYISLPQIIVCGDQSSGKSSVLEAISGVQFPVRSNLCTRFPIELVLRKSETTGVYVDIIKHKDGASSSNANADNPSLTRFRKNLANHKDLPGLIEDAKNAMGFATEGKAFSKDILRIEVSGPGHPHLTIVDLPGLIHSETRYQSESDVEMIQEVVQAYMSQRRTIILAVVSAKNDYANQIVLKLARLADPRGIRTLGVITKPDTLLPSSLSENKYVSLAKNEEIEFRLGWHVLRNQDSEAGQYSLADRDEVEAQFFSRGAWSDLTSEILGVKKLRNKLSDLLFRQIATELPTLVKEIKDKEAHCRYLIEKLGKPRSTVVEQRRYIIEVSGSFNSLLRAAINGNYEDSFFGDTETLPSCQRHLRSVIQNLNDDFAKDMSGRGRHYEITSYVTREEPPHGREFLTRDKFIEKVIGLMHRSRGRELSGMFDPMIVARLFRQQSSPWTEIANTHVRRVWGAVEVFLMQLTTHVADSSTVLAILKHIVKPKLEDVLRIMREKTSEVLKPHQHGHPVTYNQAFLEKVAQIRSKRYSAQIERIIQANCHPLDATRLRNDVDLEEFRASIIAATNETDGIHYAASQVLDYVEAYYEIALHRFVDDIAIEVIENCLMSQLEQVFSIMEVVEMSLAKVAQIAGESDVSRKAREELTMQLDVLTKGLETCRDYIVDPLTPSTSEEEIDEVGLAPEEQTTTLGEDAAPQVSLENEAPEAPSGMDSIEVPASPPESLHHDSHDSYKLLEESRVAEEEPAKALEEALEEAPVPAPQSVDDDWAAPTKSYRKKKKKIRAAPPPEVDPGEGIPES